MDAERKTKWGEGRLLAAALVLLLLLCVVSAVNRLPRSVTVQPVHASEADLYDFVMIDLNNDGLERLMRLPGVGATLADRIVAGRPYASVDDLLRVEGIGPDKLEKIRPLVKIG